MLLQPGLLQCIIERTRRNINIGLAGNGYRSALRRVMEVPVISPAALPETNRPAPTVGLVRELSRQVLPIEATVVPPGRQSLGNIVLN